MESQKALLPRLLVKISSCSGNFSAKNNVANCPRTDFKSPMVSWGHADLDLVRDFHEGSHETTLVSFVNLHPLQDRIICCTSGAFVKLCTLFTDHVDGCGTALSSGE